MKKLRIIKGYGVERKGADLELWGTLCGATNIPVFAIFETAAEAERWKETSWSDSRERKKQKVVKVTISLFPGRSKKGK